LNGLKSPPSIRIRTITNSTTPAAINAAHWNVEPNVRRRRRGAVRLGVGRPLGAVTALLLRSLTIVARG